MSDNNVKIKVSLDGADTVQKGLNGVGNSASDADSKLGGMVSGGLKGAGAALGAFALAAAAAGGALAVSVVKNFANYEQQVGGIETLFKDSASKLEGYAADAYKTAGLSANDYMSQVTSFSAALIQGLGGDTDKAADIANRAVTDMSDNANKFGSNIADIQNAYQGFAKQNFTMLDNLKLGYGGTQAEMARLINDSGVLGDSFVATAANVNSVSYDKVIEAIGVIQDKLGVTGTTAKEAASTISGSAATMRAAWENLVTGLGRSDADVSKLAGDVVTALDQVITNITPVIENIGTNIATLAPQLSSLMEKVVGALADAIPAVISAGVALVSGLLQGIVSALPNLLVALIPALLGLVQTVVDIAPQLVVAGVQAIAALANGISTALPQLIPAVISGILGVVQALITMAPLLISSGITLIMGLVTGLIDSIPLIIDALPDLVSAIVDFIVTSVPDILDAGITLLSGILEALPTVISSLMAALPQIITAIITAVLGAIPLIIQAGITLLTSLVTALPTIITAIVAALPQIITSIITAVVGAIPSLIQAGIDLFIALIGALPQIIVAIVGAIPQIIVALVSGIIASIPAIIKAGIQLITSLITDLPTIIGAIIKAIPDIVTGIFKAFTDPKMIGQLGKAGLQLIQGLWEGISDAGVWLWKQVSGFMGGLVKNIKGFFGIHSPSKLMEDEIGAMLPAGIGIGVTANVESALGPIDDLNSKILDQALGLNTQASFTGTHSFTQSLVPMFPTATSPGPINVEAALDTNALANALFDSFSANDKGQAPVALSRESIALLASAIIDSLQVQSRKGVSILG